jgi:transcriptional regulator
MYLPMHFREQRTHILHELIRTQPFATLVTQSASGLVANHLPFELDESTGELGVLQGHVARANPVWKEQGGEALVIFQGPQGYVTPAYYPTKATNAKVVPTWNYVAVHAYGPLRAIEDPVWLRAFVERLTIRHEGHRHAATGAIPWQVSDAPEDYIASMLKAIVGIEIPIARLEGKWKMNQNRTREDRAGVVSGLRQDGEPGQKAMADLVAERN